jgi:hypothetical protein
MKRFMVIGAILASVVVCVLLVSTSVSTMAKEGTKWMVIKVNAETGKVIVTDEKGNPIDPLDCKKASKILGDKHRFEYIGTVLYSHKSPGCITWTDMMGFVHVRCWP